ncbi:glycosyltransferase [Aurantiacibacter hainanensis]|uniref:glycosyltransferase n=1 Tax=Aurantiacibacter hainanensis TaxID=3076114 RepID=UPI0030C700DB
MKVALFLYHFPVRSETFVIQHAMALSRAGVDLTIITQKDCGGWENFDPRVAAELKDRIVVLPATDRPRWPVQLLRTLFSSSALKLLRLLLFSVLVGRRDIIRDLPVWTKMAPIGRFDVILAHFGPVGVLAMILRKAGYFEGPIATIFHGFDMSRRKVVRRYRKGYSKLFDLGELMLPISELWRSRLLEWGAPAEKIEVLHMGVDLPEDRPDYSREGNDPLRILSVGRLTRKKAHADVIEAVAGCKCPVELDVIGAGEEEPRLRALARSIAGDRVNLLGPRPHKDVLKAFAEADVFILPSVTADDGEMEGIPLVLMEAMAAGTTVITTRHSGIPELVEHGVTGFLVDEHDPAAITNVVEGILAGAYDLPAIREQAFERVREDFYNPELNNRLLELLEGLAVRHSHDRTPVQTTER